MHAKIMKNVDENGRLVLPKKWRDKYLEGQSVILEIDDDEIRIKTYKPPDILKLLNSIDVDVKSDLSDWKSVKRELIEKQIH
jgi:bifunctional DNA-binding transcriptional regulator/antitoxin component of YhaV-PrlF toxin-antitoxin module